MTVAFLLPYGLPTGIYNIGSNIYSLDITGLYHTVHDESYTERVKCILFISRRDEVKGRVRNDS